MFNSQAEIDVSISSTLCSSAHCFISFLSQCVLCIYIWYIYIVSILNHRSDMIISYGQIKGKRKTSGRRQVVIQGPSLVEVLRMEMRTEILPSSSCSPWNEPCSFLPEASLEVEVSNAPLQEMASCKACPKWSVLGTHGSSLPHSISSSLLSQVLST